MRAISFLKLNAFTLSALALALAMTNASYANDLAQIQVQDSNVKYAHCMDIGPQLKTDSNCVASGTCNKNTLYNFYAKESHELNCRKQYGGPVLTYSFVDH
ncbi:hypothetical protein MNBD_GAMMA07-1025 [hydrothermal vent metagenome]|uniref:Uncharacterized protein n=1 Tax=hydrothermal vent metagenome TaxID=652676 RepID=A0A3B0X0A4_9ZZZZ